MGSPWLRVAFEARYMLGVCYPSLWMLRKTIVWSLDFAGDFKMLEIQETCETYQGEPVQKTMLQLIKQKKVGNLKNPVIVDIGYRMWSWPSLCFGPLICYYVPFLPFGILTCILCHCILEVCDYNLLIDFVFRGDCKRFPWISEETLNSRFLNILRLW